MELRYLRYFLAVAETGNFTRAAERLSVAQSALSQQIARLEAEFGTPLFFRTARNVRLTPAGDVLRPLATRILADVEHAAGAMAALTRLERGRLRLGIIQTDASAIDSIELISAYHARHPGLELHVRTAASSDLAVAVAAGELDVAIVAFPRSALPPKLTHYPIVDDPLVAVISRAAAAGLNGEISIMDLLSRGTFIHHLRGSGLRRSIAAAFDRAGIVVEPFIELDHIGDMIRLAAFGVGVTVVPKASTQAITVVGRASGADFVAIALADRSAVHPIGVVYDGGRLTPAATAFLAMLGAWPETS